MKHVMLDIETMGNRPGCAIVSIGAVRFDPHGVGIDDIFKPENRFYRVIDLGSCLQAGLKIQASTLYWWLGQSDKARAALCEKDRVGITHACAAFKVWFQGSTYVWSHGASFDVPILEMAFAHSLKEGTPWLYKNVRDTRTLFDLAKTKSRSNSNAHHALADAETQALEVIDAYAALKGE